MVIVLTPDQNEGGEWKNKNKKLRESHWNNIDIFQFLIQIKNLLNIYIQKKHLAFYIFTAFIC